jgi:hypothetical protein
MLLNSLNCTYIDKPIYQFPNNYNNVWHKARQNKIDLQMPHFSFSATVHFLCCNGVTLKVYPKGANIFNKVSI